MNYSMPECSEIISVFIHKVFNIQTYRRIGIFHGIITGIFLILPIVAINAMFERRGYKYIFINAGYWLVSLAIMGGIICAYS